MRSRRRWWSSRWDLRGNQWHRNRRRKWRRRSTPSSFNHAAPTSVADGVLTAAPYPRPCPPAADGAEMGGRGGEWQDLSLHVPQSCCDQCVPPIARSHKLLKLLCCLSCCWWDWTMGAVAASVAPWTTIWNVLVGPATLPRLSSNMGLDIMYGFVLGPILISKEWAFVAILVRVGLVVSVLYGQSRSSGFKSRP